MIKKGNHNSQLQILNSQLSILNSQLSTLIRLFREELYANQSYFVVLVVATEFVHSVVYAVRLALAEVLIDVVHLIFVHDIFEEVVDVHFCTAVYDGVNLVQQFFKLKVERGGDVVERHAAVKEADDLHLRHRVLRHGAHEEFFRTFYLVLLTVSLD